MLAGSGLRRPSSIVVDAHVAAGQPTIAAFTARSGVPFLVEPQTFFLQHDVHSANAWTLLPFAVSARLSAAEITGPSRAAEIAHGVIDYQLGHGASHVIAPYVHVEQPGQGWDAAQVAPWDATRGALDVHGLDVPLVATLALGWRRLARTAWPATLLPLVAALRDRDPDEVALAASKVDAAVRPEDRLPSMLAVIERLTIDFPVIAWQQGALGEAAVLAGALGYETGIGRREHCDLQTRMRSLKDAPANGGAARPVYVPTLRRAVDKRILSVALGSQRWQGGLVCLDSTCCPDGPRSLLADARQPSVNARLTNLARAVAPAHPAWRWAQLADDTDRALDLARRLNHQLATAGAGVPRIHTGALCATRAVAVERRTTRRRSPAA